MFNRNQQAVRLDAPGTFAGLMQWLRLFLIIALIVIVVVWSYLKISDPATLPILKVRALGDFSYVTEEMLNIALTDGVKTKQTKSVLNVFENKGFFNIDVDEIKNRVEKMAWVSRASVQRVWPDTLVIEVVEHQPVAYWGIDGLVNNRGEIFRPESGTYPKNLPRFIVTDGIDEITSNRLAKKCLRYFTDASEIFSGINLTVTSVKFNVRQSLTLSLANGIELRLGRQNKLYRLQRFARIYSTLRERTSLIERVDMRYTNGFSVKWKQRQANGEQYLKVKSEQSHV